MKKSSLYLSGAVVAALSLTGCDFKKAEEAVESAALDHEKCYGIARAGMNDCASTADPTSCQGTAKTDSDLNAWMYVPGGVCEKIVGGNLKPASQEMHTGGL